MPPASIEERLATIEEWMNSHANTHRLEGEALKVAATKDAAALVASNANLEKRLEGLNDVRARFVAKDWFEKVHSTLEEKVERVATDLGTRIKAVETVQAGQEGRREPIGDFVKWAAAVLAGLFIAFCSWLAGHFMMK